MEEYVALAAGMPHLCRGKGQGRLVAGRRITYYKQLLEAG